MELSIPQQEQAMPMDYSGAGQSASVGDAAKAFDQAAQAFLRHRPGVPDALAAAVKVDPDFAAAHAFAGLAQILLARRETLDLANNYARRASDAAGKCHLLPAEQALVEALQVACSGRWMAAADILQAAILPGDPDALLIKLVHALRFLCGDREGMFALTAPFAASEGAGFAGHGFILGCHAFALEENGEYVAAEEMAQRALHLAPDDIWAMHALAHVYDASNRTGEGLLWVESGRQSWSHCNNFAYHMAWHLALFNVERGKYDRALAIYDEDLRNVKSEDFRDIANAVSLLVRIRQMGGDIGNRFDYLYECAQRRKTDTAYVFASLHHLLTLLHCRDFTAVSDLLSAMRDHALNNGDDQAQVAADVGIPLAEALVSVASQNKSANDFLAVAEKFPRLGGSFTQRDLFMRSLILMAADICDHKTVAGLVALRHRMRHADSFSLMMKQRMCFGASGSGNLDVA